MNAVDVVARPFARAARSPLFAPLAGRDFRLVWFGESVSYGSGTETRYGTALPSASSAEVVRPPELDE